MGLAKARILPSMPRTRLSTQSTAHRSALAQQIGARIRDGVAVAEARNRSCSACFMSLRPQVMAEVRRGEDIITCDNCGRILYVVPPEPAKADAAKTQPNVAIS